MGRTLKRVPADFSWPLNKTWDGYLNPHYRPCPGEGLTCFRGMTAAGQWLEAICRLVNLIGEHATDPPSRVHPWLEHWALAPRIPIPYREMKRIRAIDDEPARQRAAAALPNKLVPITPEIRQLFAAIAGEEPSFGGSFSWGLAKRLMEAAGVNEETWGQCPICGGEDIDPAIKDAWEAWAPTEPPSGPGFQLWETTSEGSPVSPVFKTIDELCDWCAINATTFGPQRATSEEWRKMLGEDFVHAEVVMGNGTKAIFI